MPVKWKKVLGVFFLEGTRFAIPFFSMKDLLKISKGRWAYKGFEIRKFTDAWEIILDPKDNTVWCWGFRTRKEAMWLVDNPGLTDLMEYKKKFSQSF